MERVKLEFNKRIFKSHRAWVLRPDSLSEKYGKINFETVKFFLEDGSRYHPEGGGPDKYIKVTHVYKDKDTFIEFDKDDFFPDPWIIRHRVILVEFEYA